MPGISYVSFRSRKAWGGVEVFTDVDAEMSGVGRGLNERGREREDGIESWYKSETRRFSTRELLSVNNRYYAPVYFIGLASIGITHILCQESNTNNLWNNQIPNAQPSIVRDARIIQCSLC